MFDFLKRKIYTELNIDEVLALGCPHCKKHVYKFSMHLCTDTHEDLLPSTYLFVSTGLVGCKYKKPYCSKS